MKKFIKSALIFLGTLSAIIFISLIILMFSHDQHNDLYYKTPDEFLIPSHFHGILIFSPKAVAIYS